MLIIQNAIISEMILWWKKSEQGTKDASSRVYGKIDREDYKRGHSGDTSMFYNKLGEWVT